MNNNSAPSKQAFYAVSAPAGSGKTYAAIDYAIHLAQNNQKVIIAQPTKALIDQTETDIIGRNSGVKLTKIVSPTAAVQNASVQARVLEHMKDNESGGEILLISHQVLGRLPNAWRQFWHLIVDEVPGAYVAHNMNIAKSHGFVTQHTALGDILTDTFHIVEAADVGALRDLAENKTGDATYKLFKDLVDDILNEDKFVCVDADAYAELTSNNGKRKHIDFHSFQRSDYVRGFASVTVMGANFADTELAHIWGRLESVVWKDHPVIGQNLRYTHHQNGARLTIKYLIDGNWSQYFASMPHEKGTILNAITEAMEAELSHDFIWQANKKHGDFLFNEGMMLPQVIHGINRRSYQAKHGVALVKAINHSSGPAAFLKALGFTQEELKVTLQYQNEYQAMMRCSLRDRTATEDVTVCVVSKGSAKWLQALFPNSDVQKLESDVPEPKPSGQPVERKRSDAEKMHDSRQNKLVREAAARGEVYVAKPWTPKPPKPIDF